MALKKITIKSIIGIVSGVMIFIEADSGSRKKCWMTKNQASVLENVDELLYYASFTMSQKHVTKT